MRPVLLLLPLSLLACDDTVGDRDDTVSSSALVGLYEVVDAVSGDCTSTSAADPGFDYFSIEFRNVFGFEALAMVGCSSASTCDGTPTYFEDWDDIRASGVTETTNFSGSECTLTWTAAEVDHNGDGTVSFAATVTEVTGVTGVDLDDCISQQEAWTEAQPCVGLTEVTGQLVE